MSGKRSKERERLKALYGFLYERHYSEIGDCFYCGDRASTVDHVPPLSWVEARRTEDWRKAGVRFVTVSCCTDCNRRLGDRGLFTTVGRVEFVAGALERQYEKRQNLWTDEEMGEMSREFRKVILARREESRGLLVRARFAQLRCLRLDTHPGGSNG